LKQLRYNVTITAEDENLKVMIERKENKKCHWSIWARTEDAAAPLICGIDKNITKAKESIKNFYSGYYKQVRRQGL
jgi:hypothetical protein